MRYLPHTQEEIAFMLEAVGVASLEDLYPTVPEDCRRERAPDLPEPLTEWELTDLANSLSSTVAVPPATKVFLGAGSYEHYVPAAILRDRKVEIIQARHAHGFQHGGDLLLCVREVAHRLGSFPQGPQQWAFMLS